MAGLAMLFMAVSLLVAAPAVYAASHIVGGTSGWDQGVNYVTWAVAQTFTVGDTLVFNYRLNHAVDHVSATDYNSCSSANPIKSYGGGTTNITLSTAGAWYFICPTSGHCSSGQALSITVAAATTPSPPGVTASPPPPGTTTTTPSTPPPAGLAGGLVVSILGPFVCIVYVLLMSV